MGVLCPSTARTYWSKSKYGCSVDFIIRKNENVQK